MTQTLSHEAWCPSCRVTHPPGTRRCLHCGGPVLPERPAAGGIAPGPVVRQGTPTPWPIEAGEEEEARESMRAARPLKIGMAALWIVLAIVTGILRACAERG
jgi:hypothetical protein